MQQIADNVLDQLRRRYHATALPEFLSWWGGELAALLPDGFRKRLMPPKPQLWIVPAATGGGDLRIWRCDESARVVDVFGAGEDIELLRTRWRDLVGSFDDGAPEVRLCLPEEQYLALPVELPSAVEGELGQALTYQLDEISPFRADQVMLDYRVEETDSEHDRIRAGLRIVPVETVDELLDRVRAFGAVVHAVDTLSPASGDDEESDRPEPEGFNLLPQERRPRYVHARARLNAMLGLGFVVALALVMAQSLILRERSLSLLEQEAERLGAQARQVMQLREQLEDSLMAANFLARRRAQQPTVIELLDEVTRRLPDDIWLQRFQLRDGELRIQGLADGSQRIIGLLNESQMLHSPEIQGTITIDPNTGKERFSSIAQVVRGGETPGDPSGRAADNPEGRS